MKYLGILVLLMAAAMAKADCSAKGCNTTIKRIYATGHSDGRVYIQPNESSLSGVNCSPLDDTYFILRKSHPLFNEIYSMALASITTKASVNLRIKEGSAGCDVEYMWMWAPN